MDTSHRDPLNRIVTIPNLLSLFRLCLIPVFVHLYHVQNRGLAAALVLALSALTDLADGFIARRFHLITNLGKVLDPVADKLTQIAALLCLATHFPHIWVLLLALIAKELFIGLTGLLAIRRTGVVHGADWHGKLTTTALHATALLHILFPRLPAPLSDGLIVLCLLLMLLSAILYGVSNLSKIRKGGTHAHEP